MARRGSLSASLTPFGGGGVDFGAFSRQSASQTKYLAFLREDVKWQAGQITDEEYLAALERYVNSLTPGRSERISAENRLRETRYNLARDKLVTAARAGTKTWSDVIEFDRQALAGLNESSNEYRTRLDRYHASQGQMFGELEREQVQRYSEGKITSAQLMAWYRARIDPSGEFSDNPELVRQVEDRIVDLNDRVQNEHDSLMLQRFQDGKISPSSFIAYATAAQARYAPDTPQSREWADRIEGARDQQTEGPLLYRYGLAQKYAELAEFVKGAAGRGGGKGRTSTTTRDVLGADGQWHTVTTTKTTPYKPSAGSVAAYRKLQIQVADAKRQMAEIAKKIRANGGWVSTDQMLGYYRRQLPRYAKGSPEYYRVLDKLDSLEERRHAESVSAKLGLRVTPVRGGGGGGGATGAASTAGGGTAVSAGGTTISQFMAAIARVESGGRYDAVNRTSGAYGKYQIMPANWSGWAGKYLGDPSAKPTPENQEKVARGKMLDLYRWLGDWRAVAHWWLAGGSDKGRHLNPQQWSAQARGYVNKVMAGLGQGKVPNAPLTGQVYQAAGVSGTKARARGAAPPPAGGRHGLTALVGAQREETGGISVQTRDVGYPRNLDGEAFKNLYSAYSAAYEAGKEGFTWGGYTYYIGNDAASRIAGMQELDSLRIQLFERRVKDKDRTQASRISAANQLTKAHNDALEHAAQVLFYDEPDIATVKAAPGSYTALYGAGAVAGAPRNVMPRGTVAGTNAVQGGLEFLDKQKATITTYVDIAEQLVKEGDLTGAYNFMQEAAILSTQGPTNFITKANQTLERIGPVKISESDRSMLERLNAWQAELEAELDKGSDVASEIQKNVKMIPGTDQPAWTTEADGSRSLQLLDSRYYHLTLDGQLRIETKPPAGIDVGTGREKNQMGNKTVYSVARVGDRVVHAYADYIVDTVGYFVDPDGNRFPINGKVIVRETPDGRVSSYEDPFHPGHWSATPYRFKVQGNFKVSGSPDASRLAYQFMVGATRVDLEPTPDGYFNLTKTKLGMTSSEPEVFGPGVPGTEDLFRQLGVSRDQSGDDPNLTDTPSPIVMSGNSYKVYKAATEERILAAAQRAYAPIVKAEITKIGSSLGSLVATTASGYVPVSQQYPAQLPLAPQFNTPEVRRYLSQLPDEAVKPVVDIGNALASISKGLGAVTGLVTGTPKPTPRRPDIGRTLTTKRRTPVRRRLPPPPTTPAAIAEDVRREGGYTPTASPTISPLQRGNY